MRDRILVLLSIRGGTHLSEIARIYGKTVTLTQRTVRGLERDGLIVAITHGRTRLLQLNPRWYGLAALRKLLQTMASAQPELYAPAESVRARPRRSGKPM
jgi:DNA-binding MarR family transcriptional regulator